MAVRDSSGESRFASIADIEAKRALAERSLFNRIIASRIQQGPGKRLRSAVQAAAYVGIAVSGIIPQAINAAFATMQQRRADGLLVTGDPFLRSRRQQIVALATRDAIPQCMGPFVARSRDALRRNKSSGIGNAADKKCSRRVLLSMAPEFGDVPDRLTGQGFLWLGGLYKLE
jgi:hypothetical protein